MNDPRNAGGNDENAGNSIQIPTREIDLGEMLERLEDSRNKYIDSLNKPILTIAPSSIAATIAFVGAVSEKLTFGGWESVFLVSSWTFWLLSILAILGNFVLRIIATEKPLKWAKQFSQLDLDAPNVPEQIQSSVLRNRSMFEIDDKVIKYGNWLQISAPVMFAFGFISVFGFLIKAFLFD